MRQSPRSLTSLSFLSLLAYITLFLSPLFSGPVAAQDGPINVTFPAFPSPEALENVVQDNFLGISFELSSFDTLWGKSPSFMPNAMQNYLSNLRARISNPLRIRIGGNSMDGSTYVPDQQDMIILTDPNAYFNDVPVNFGPTFFDVLNAMADRIGEMLFIVGLSMRDPANDTNVLMVANASTVMLGERLDAMLLGNEPDIYAGHGTRQGYTISDYIPEIGQVLNDLQDSPYGDLINDTIVGGPSICCGWDLDSVLSAGLNQYPYKYYTLQHYPTYSCQGPTPQNTNISYFLSHSNVPGYAQWEQTGMGMAKQQGVPVLITEYNTVSCGGSNISDTFAAALWAIDAGLQFASSNVSGAYLHTREYGVTYNLFDPPTPDTSTETGWRTGSVYYAALALSEIFGGGAGENGSGGSVVIDLNIDNSIYDPASTVAGYGIYDASSNTSSNGTSTLKKLVLINYSRTNSRTFNIPPSTAAKLGVRVLTAPVVEERVDISWAGQTVGQNGDLEGSQTTTYVNCRGSGTGSADSETGSTCEVEVPGPGAALVLLDPNDMDEGGFFEGNSTIAGLEGYTSGVSGVMIPWLIGSMTTISCMLLMF